MPQDNSRTDVPGQVLGTPKLWLFDMDDTLYDATHSVFEEIHPRMEAFIMRRLQVDAREAARLQHGYWAQYGATFLGLALRNGIKPEEFLREAHDFDVERAVRNSAHPQCLAGLIRRLPGKKAVLTNGPRAYAERVLVALKVKDPFDFMMTANDMHMLGSWRCKPDPVLLIAACRKAGVKPAHAVVIDDSLANLKVCHRLGMRTVWCTGYRYASAVKRPAFVDAAVTTVEELPRLLTAPRKLPSSPVKLRLMALEQSGR
jgi:putative hydrolase of the HAD superfamily